MSVRSVSHVAYGPWRLGLRSFSHSTRSCVGLKESVHKFILENPHLSPKTSGSLNVPVSKGVSKMQEDMIKQLEVVDLEFRTYKERRIQPSTRENPNLVGSALERQVSTCVCYPDTHYVRYMVLYRDLPMRCQCGHWFKLIDMDRFEQEREKHWQKIKDEPENAKLLQQLTDTENELNRLMEKGKDIKRTSPGADDLLEALANQWEKLKTTYAAIRRKMELP